MFLKLRNFIVTVLNTVLFFLPDCPFEKFLHVTLDNDVLCGLNWVIPIGEMIVIGEVWLVAIGVFYTYQVVLRWAKAVE